MHKSQGASLMELVITTSVVAILATLAAPSLSALLADNERTAMVNGLFHTLFLARSESIKRGLIVTVCRSADRQSCLRNGDWSSGWIAFVNNDRDEPAERDEGELVIATHEGWTRGRITSNRAAFSFRPYMQGVINGTIVFCDSRGSQHARAIIVNHAGRPRVSQRDSSGRPLRCSPG